MDKVLLALLLVLLVLLLTDTLVQRIFIPSFYPFPFEKDFTSEFPIIKHSATWKTDTVSKIIHQTAPADKSRWNPIWFECQKTWKEKFPDYEYKLWTDEDLDEFIKEKFAWFYPTFKSYDQNIKRIDSARYFILYEYGGIYADMDYECIENFEKNLPMGKVSIAEGKFIDHPIFSEKYQNALMASPPKHPFWNYVIKSLFANKSVDHVLFSTGPNVILEAVRDCKSDMFHSLSHAEYTNGDRWAKHYGTTSWEKNEFIRKLQMFLYNLQ
jgi:mannosyltransferase OCH1-like enzyme